MNPLKRLGIALLKTLVDQGDLIATQVLLPPVSGAIQSRLCQVATGSPIPPQGRARLATYRGLVTVTVDGAAVDGAVPGAWAKYAIPKGLPAEEGERRMAIENQPHRVDDFDGIIAEGYGKGPKKLVYSGTVAVKIDGETSLRKINIHRHEAERAGAHYDLVCEGVPMNTERWELNIPNGPFKGRYAFVDASGALSTGEYNEGRLITRMRDRGVRLDKPGYRLRDRAWLESEVRRDPSRHSVERKYDGGLVNAVVDQRTARMYLRSHREGGDTYYDRFPGLEYLENASPLLSCRLAFPKPEISALFRAELVHPDGAARVGGLSNSMPDKSQQYQREHGDAELYVWDVAEYKGKDVSALPYRERRAICKKLVAELKPYCKNIHLAEAAPGGSDAVAFYEKVINDRRGLPYSEGVVVKDLNDPSGRTWFKLKPRDFFDWSIAEVVEGTGKYAATAGAIVVEHPETGARSELGSLAVADAERQWIWDHRTRLEGHAVAKFEAMEITDAGAVRAGVFTGLHQAKGDEGALQAIAQHELAVAG
jgi:hypothetical protein